MFLGLIKNILNFRVKRAPWSSLRYTGIDLITLKLYSGGDTFNMFYLLIDGS